MYLRSSAKLCKIWASFSEAKMVISACSEEPTLPTSRSSSMALVTSCLNCRSVPHFDSKVGASSGSSISSNSSVKIVSLPV